MLSTLINGFGKKAAVRHYQLCKEAIETLEQKVVPTLEENSDFKIRKSLYFASSENDLEKLRKEYYTLKKYGFPVEFLWENQIEEKFSFSKPGAIVTDGDAELNPYKHAQLLIHYALNNGTKIFSNTKINGRKQMKDSTVLYTDNGFEIKAKYIIYATGYESQEIKKDPNGQVVSSYAISTNVIENLPGWYDDMMIWETARPYIYARRTKENRIVFGGLDESTIHKKKRDTMLIHKRDLLLEKLIELFPELHGKVFADFYWGAFFGETHDGLPTIGIYEDYPNSYFLRGFGGNGTVYSIILSQIIKDLIVKGYHNDAYIYMKERAYK